MSGIIYKFACKYRFLQHYGIVNSLVSQWCKFIIFISSPVLPETGNFKSISKFMVKIRICLEMALLFGMPKTG